MDHAALEGLDETPRTAGGHCFRFVSTRFDVPVVLSEEDRPADEKGLRAISGVGPSKLTKYGDEVLAVVADGSKG